MTTKAQDTSRTDLSIVSGAANVLVQFHQEAGIVLLVNMVHVPQATIPDFRSPAVVPQPSRAGWIDRAALVRQHRDRIAFDISPITARAGFVWHIDPVQSQVAHVP